MANKFLTKILGLESILGRLRKLLGLGANTAGLRIPNPIEEADENHRTSMACKERLVESLIEGEALSTSKYGACVQQSSRDGLDIK